MLRYLQKRRRRWYTIMEILKDLREYFGKPRFVKSLETESLTVAERKVHRPIAETMINEIEESSIVYCRECERMFASKPKATDVNFCSHTCKIEYGAKRKEEESTTATEIRLREQLMLQWMEKLINPSRRYTK